MSLPTLLRKGFVVPPRGMSKSQKESLKNTRSIDFITDFISDRTTVNGSEPKIRPVGPGDRVIVLKSQTGSGKSTVLPPFLYETFQERTHKNIIVTQPRVLTAIDISEGLPEFYPFLEMDINLGYNTGDFKRKPSEKGLIYATTGILLQQLKVMSDEDLMDYYSYILIDEVHARDINVDMTLYTLKKFLAKNYKDPRCPMVILMSATFKPKLFIDYFGCPKENFISVVGSTFPIENHFLKHDSTDYIAKAVSTAEKLHVENYADIEENSKFRDILIFVLGAAPVREIMEKLHLFNHSLDSNFIAPIELTGKSFDLSGVEYQNLFSDISNIVVPLYVVQKGKVTAEIDRWVEPSRRIIVATNIAETGVTIETLKYCIDTGFVNIAEFNPDYGILSIIAKNVTKGMATQRKGRVGRKSPGQWYPCYTEETFESLEDDQFADILISDISENILNIIIKETETDLYECKDVATLNMLEKGVDINECSRLKLFKKHYLVDPTYYYFAGLKKMNMASVDFLESPSSSSLNYSVEKLHGLGFIDGLYNPTRLGMYAFKMRKLSMESRRLLFAGYSHGANVLDLITMVAFTEIERRNFMHRKYSPINMFKKKLSDAEYEFYYKIVIGDEMIEYIMIWELLSEFLNSIVLNKSKKKFSIANIEQWCLDHRLVYKGMCRVVAMRNEIIEMFISAGMNPYYNGMDLKPGTYNLLNMFRGDLQGFILEITKIKKCIVDGYRFNLCVWNEAIRKYILHYRNIPVYVRSNVTGRMGDQALQTNPHFIIPSNVMLRQSMKDKTMYEFESSGSVSIMDPHVNIDLNFIEY
jgi:HrpA-like RNA helicase